MIFVTFKKQFLFDNKLINVYCYDRVPTDQPEDIQVVLNHGLDVANQLIEYVYNLYRPQYAQLTKPNVFLCFREDNIADINAFTDGKDIYLEAGIIVGMNSYISERLTTDRYDGSKLFMENLETASKLKIQDYLLELIVAHELTHIWHNHKTWKNNELKIGTSSNVFINDIFQEKAGSSDDTFIEAAINIDSLFSLTNIQTKVQYNFVQQILELDCDCCAVSIIINKMLQETELECATSATTHGFDQNKHMNFSIWYRSNLIGFILAASGLMCGFFNRRYQTNSFASLNNLLSSGHPIPAIRFYKMQLTINTMLYNYYEYEEIVSRLLREENTYSIEIFMHQNGIKNINNCFWLPVYTQEAQKHISLLEAGWNIIHDSLQKYSIIKLPSKFTLEDLEIPPENIWFDKSGKLIK